MLVCFQRRIIFYQEYIYSDLYISFEPSSNCENSPESPAVTVDLEVLVLVRPI